MAIETLNAWGRSWTGWAASGIVEALVAVLVLCAVWAALRRRAPAWVGCTLFLLVFVKMLIPVSVPLPERFARWAPRACVGRWLGPTRVAERSTSSALTRPVQRTGNFARDATMRTTGHARPQRPAPLDAASNADMDMTSAARSGPAPGRKKRTESATDARDQERPASSGSAFSDHAALSPAVSASRRSVEASAWLFLAWCAVVGGLVIQFAATQFRFARVVRRARPIDTSRWPLDVDALCRACGCRRPVRFLESAEIAGPAVWGLLRPCVVLPSGIDAVLTPAQLKWLLLHELAHVRRCDLHAILLQRGVTMVHFFNPALWFAGRMVQRLREYACDDAASERARIAPRESGSALLQVLEHAAAAGERLELAPGMFGGQRALRRRFARLIDERRAVRTRAGALSVAALLLTAALVLPHVRATGNAPAVPAPSAGGVAVPAAAETDDRLRPARQLIERLQSGEFDRAAELFSPALREELTAARLQRLWWEYERPQRAGSFEHIQSCRVRELHDQAFVEVRGRWEKAVMLVRLAVDNGRVTGFWLARDPQGPTPRHFRHGGYAYGAVIRKLAERMHPEAYRKPSPLGIDVRILGADGQPIDETSAVTIWRRVEPSPEPQRYTVVDPRDGTIWKRVTGSISGQRSATRNGQDRFLAEGLEPGVYRVTAFVGSRSERMLGMAVSDPLQLDESSKILTTRIPIEAGPTVDFSVLSAETRAPIDYPRPGIRLTRDDGLDVEWNPLNGNLFPGDDGRYRIEHLKPGSYRVDVSATTGFYGYPDYGLAEPIQIDVVGGQPNEFVLQLQPRPLDDDEAQRRWPWAVEGKVTDTAGRPVVGAAIRAARGWGTLRSTMPVFSDADGRYLLRFGPGMRTKNDETGEWGAGIQAATISVSKPGLAEKNLGRQGGLLMGDTLPDEESDFDPTKVILPGKPYRVDFTMVPAASVDGLLLDENGQPLADHRVYLTGDVLGPSTSVAGSGRTDAGGRFHFEGIAPAVARWFVLPDAEDLTLSRTQPVSLAEGAEYDLVLQIKTSGDTERMLRITSARDAAGRDVLDAISGDDPRGRPFVEAELETKARQLLQRVASTNRYWFGLVPRNVESFSYVFHRGDNETRKITYQDYRQARGWHREWYAKGISYTGAARVLASLRDRARFRVVDVGEQEIVLYFVLDGLPSTVAAGNGIARSWSGFFQTRMREGRIRIDAERFTPISIQYGERREVYSDYVEVDDGHYVPRRIQLLAPGSAFDFRFCVFEPNLWLFDRSLRGGDEEAGSPLAWTSDVFVNGAPARKANR